MLADRIIGAFTFRRSVYAEVEEDTSFTTTAWLLVIVIGFLNQLGSHASTNLLEWLGSAIVGMISVIIGFAVAAFVMSWLGRQLFRAEVNFDEMVRTLGLAYVWNVVGVIGAVSAFSGLLSCVLAPALVVGWIMLIISWFVAAKEALDLDTGQTIITVILGWVAFGIIMAIGSMILNLIGWTAAGLGSLIGL
jgi:hypothetical protein